MTVRARGGIFGLNPFFRNLAATNFEADAAEFNGDVRFAQDVTIVGTLMLNGQSLGGLVLQGTWNADTNTPDLTATTPTNNHFWIVSDAGDTTLGPISDWAVNDWAVYINDAWTKISAGNRTAYSQLDIGDLNIINSTISATGTATDITITPGTNGYLVSNAIKTAQIYATGGSGTGDLALVSGGSTTMTLDENNHVGIGTSTPVGALHVAAQSEGASSSPGVIIGMSGPTYASIELAGSGGSFIDFQKADGTDFGGRIQYDHSDNRMRFSTNSDARLTINSSGRVGIGTENPLSALHISGAIDNSPASPGVHLGLSGNFAAMEMSSTSGGYIDFQNATDASDYSGRIIYTQSSNTMAFETDGAQRMSINNVGTISVTGSLLTTSNITSGGTLSATGLISTQDNFRGTDLSLGFGDSGNGDIQIHTATNGGLRLFGGSGDSNSGGRIELFGPTHSSDPGRVIFRTGTTGSGDVRMAIHADGDIGINRGTTDPNGKLDVAGTVALTNPSTQTEYWLMQRETTNGAWALNERTTPRFRVETTGQVAILGDDLPFDTTANANGLQLYYEDDTGVATIGAYNSSGATDIAFHTNTGSAASSEKMRITDTGGIGIGGVVNPAYTLDIGSSDTSNGYSVRIRSNSTATRSRIQFSRSDAMQQNAFIEARDTQELAFGTTGEVLRMTSGKNVGIGITSTTSKLHIREDSGDDGDVLMTLEAGAPSSATTTNNATLRFISKGTGLIPFPSLTNIAEIRAIGLPSSNSALGFFTAVSGSVAERMRINDAGAVCVGTSDQFNGAALNVDFEGVAIASALTLTGYRRCYMAASDALTWTNGTNSATLTSAGVWTDASDSEYKRDVADIDYGLETINKLQPRSFYMKSDETDDERHIGFVAQELNEFVPECVFGEEGSMNIAYGRMNAVLVKAVQELSQRIEHLEQTTHQPTA